MPRPPSDVRRRLLSLGRAFIEEHGLSALTVRGLAKRAGVNLGLFHYHFGSREGFIRELLEQTYEKFFSRLSLESSKEGSAWDRLKSALLVFGHFGRQNRKLLAVLLREALSGDRVTIAFAKRNIPRHAGVILQLLKECGLENPLSPLPIPSLMSFLLGGMGVPNAVVTLLERAKAKQPFGMSLDEARLALLSDEVLEARVKFLVNALRTGTTFRTHSKTYETSHGEGKEKRE